MTILSTFVVTSSFAIPLLFMAVVGMLGILIGNALDDDCEENWAIIVRVGAMVLSILIALVAFVAKDTTYYAKCTLSDTVTIAALEDHHLSITETDGDIYTIRYDDPVKFGWDDIVDEINEN